MSFKIFQTFGLILLFAFAATGVHAQVDASNRTSSANPGQKEDLPKGIKESLAKSRIEREKKDFAKLLERGEEALKISNELEKSFAQNNQLSAADQKKLDRLEKVVKKIREEMGGDDDDKNIESENKPSTTLAAIQFIQTNTGKLVDELKKTTRYTVSVIAVESSNLLLKIVRFLRLRQN